jgi:hypothetical protein
MATARGSSTSWESTPRSPPETSSHAAVCVTDADERQPQTANTRLTVMALRAAVGLVMGASVLTGCFAGASTDPSARSGEPTSTHATSLPISSAAPTQAPDVSKTTRRPAHVQPSGPSAAPTCLSGHLHAVMIGGGSVASQPFATIALRNAGTKACSLIGYPAIAAYGHLRGGPDHRLQIRLRDGAIYERPDPGPHVVIVAAGGHASFSIGTALAYQGGAHIILITQLEITPPGSHAAMALRLRLAASRPAGKAIPIAVTALRAGVAR